MYVRGNLPREPLPACKLGSRRWMFFEDVRTRWVAGRPWPTRTLGSVGPAGLRAHLGAGAPAARGPGRGARVGYNLVTETQYALDVSR